MRIGVPSETKTLEGRVALVPAACADLVRRGHEVYVQAGAGTKSGFSERFAKLNRNCPIRFKRRLDWRSNARAPILPTETWPKSTFKFHKHLRT